MPDGTAVIGDPRNDDHVVIAGLHAASLLFHNRVVDRLRAGGTNDPVELYAQARRLTSWRYQWLVLHEFLPLFVGQGLVNDVLRRGRRFYRPRRGEAFIPVEFQAPPTGSATRWSGRRIAPTSPETPASRSSA